MLSDMKRTYFSGQIRLLIRLAIYLMVCFIMLTACKTAKLKTEGKRYVVLSPEIAEIIAAIEGSDNIVGITEECNFPLEYAGKTVVGKFGSVNKERLISLKPSLVFASSLEQQAIASELSKLGIMVIIVYPKTINEMLTGIQTVGNAIGKSQRAIFVADSLRTELEKVRSNTTNKPRPKVYLEIYREPLMSVSDQSFVGELIELAGGDNIFSRLERDYSRIKAEDVINAKPEIMICYSQDTKDSIRKRMGWKNLPAIRNDRIYFEAEINPDLILRAGPRCILGAKRLQELFYDGK
jgi:ABC-type Fe3+-hydroxamate transport system substrate-binding protein